MGSLPAPHSLKVLSNQGFVVFRVALFARTEEVAAKTLHVSVREREFRGARSYNIDAPARFPFPLEVPFALRADGIEKSAQYPFLSLPRLRRDLS